MRWLNHSSRCFLEPARAIRNLFWDGYKLSASWINAFQSTCIYVQIYINICYPWVENQNKNSTQSINLNVRQHHQLPCALRTQHSFYSHFCTWNPKFRDLEIKINTFVLDIHKRITRFRLLSTTNSLSCIQPKQQSNLMLMHLYLIRKYV